MFQSDPVALKSRHQTVTYRVLTVSATESEIFNNPVTTLFSEQVNNKENKIKKEPAESCDASTMADPSPQKAAEKTMLKRLASKTPSRSKRKNVVASALPLREKPVSKTGSDFKSVCQRFLVNANRSHMLKPSRNQPK